MRNFCTYCGARNSPDATACLACGSPLEQAAAPQSREEEQAATQARFTRPADPAISRPIQAAGAWYSTQQHTPQNPHEPSAGTVSAWQAGQHGAMPPWPLPPAGDAQSAYASGPRVPFPLPVPPGAGQLPYPSPYGPPSAQNPYGQTPAPQYTQNPYGQAPNPPAYQSPYAQVPGRPPYENPPPPGAGVVPYQNGYPQQLPPPLLRPYPTAAGAYGAPFPTPPVDPYAAPAGDYFTPGGYGPPPEMDPSYGGYRPTPGYSSFSSARQVQEDYAAAHTYGAYVPAPVPSYGSAYSPIPYPRTTVGYPQPSGGLADGGQRFGAYLLDSMVLAVPMFFFLALIGATQSAALAGLWLMSLVLCPAIYFISAWAGNGRTIGYRAMGIRLVRTDGGQPSLGAAIARYVTLFACMFFFFPGVLGAMWMLWDERRQGWHDKVSDTLVVRS